MSFLWLRVICTQSCALGGSRHAVRPQNMPCGCISAPIRCCLAHARLEVTLTRENVGWSDDVRKFATLCHVIVRGLAKRYDCRALVPLCRQVRDPAPSGKHQYGSITFVERLALNDVRDCCLVLDMCLRKGPVPCALSLLHARVVC